MFSRFFKTRFEWRRTAVYEPVPVKGPASAAEEAERQTALKSCQAGLHVSLRRTPTSDDPGAVAVAIGDDRLIGYLPRDVGEWVGPLLDGGVAVFDAEIWSVEKVPTDAGGDALACQLLLTQHDLVPVARFALTDWLFGSRQASGPVPVPRGARDSG
jgi:hypothetical protein